MLSELIDLLTCGELERADLVEIEQAVANAPEDPEYEWADDGVQAMTFELLSSLAEFIASGDKLDEVHEQLQDMFADPLPDFPDEVSEDPSSGVLKYFQWLDAELLKRGTENGGCDVVELDDDEMNMFVVYRKDTARILQLAKAIGLDFMRPVDYWLGLQNSH